jgi:hypothetical protein
MKGEQYHEMVFLSRKKPEIRKKPEMCVSKGKASPVTAKLKCPLWKGKRYS